MPDGNQIYERTQPTSRIIGCAFEVINTLGHGLKEKVYENALVVEFQINGIPYAQQPSYSVSYKGHHVGVFVPDLVVFESVVVDTKTIDKVTDNEVGQMLNYLKITGHNIGLILNFKKSRLEWKRVVL